MPKKMTTILELEEKTNFWEDLFWPSDLSLSSATKLKKMFV
jgi:hypothetical protein